MWLVSRVDYDWCDHAALFHSEAEARKYAKTIEDKEIYDVCVEEIPVLTNDPDVSILRA